MAKSKLRIGGEITALAILLVLSVWFFLINYVTVEEGVASYEMTTPALISCIMLILVVIWGIMNLLRFKRFS